jgi:hypothetical protein
MPEPKLCLICHLNVRVSTYHNITDSIYGFSILKKMCKPQWSLGKHCVLVTFSMPTRPKWTGAALLGCECRMYARSNRNRGLNLPGISLLEFRNVSQVYWHSLREPHEIHKSSMPGGMPPASTSCEARTTLCQCSEDAVKYRYQNILPIENVRFRIQMCLTWRWYGLRNASSGDFVVVRTS